MRTSEAGVYIGAQVVGACVGVMVANLMFGLAAVTAVQARFNVRLQKALGETREAKKATDAALTETRAAKKATEEAMVLSDESRKQAQAVTEYIVSAFQKPDPEQDGSKLLVIDLLDDAVTKLDTDFSGPATTRGKLLSTLGQTYSGLGEHTKALNAVKKALAVLEAALCPDDLDVLAARSDLALVYAAVGRAD